MYNVLAKDSEIFYFDHAAQVSLVFVAHMSQNWNLD